MTATRAILIGGVPITDPHIANVIGLYHFQGTNGVAGPFINSAPAGNSNVLANMGSPNGSPTHSNTEVLYGSTSLKIPSIASAAGLTGANKPVAMGTSDFTLEFSIWPNALTGTQVLFDNRTSPTGVSLSPEIYLIGSAGQIRYFTNGADKITSANGVVTANAWNAISYSRIGTNGMLFVNGAQVGSTYTDNNTYIQGELRLGCAESNTAGMIGWMAEFRWTFGVGRYSSNYTIATAPFPNV